MKFKSVILLFITCTFLSCSLNNNDNTPDETIITQWNLVNVSGGIAGVDNTFEIGEIIWMFDDLTGQLTVTNNNTNDTIEDGLNGGVYDYFFVDDGSQLFIIIDDSEYGAITISTDNQEFTIDQNITQAGTGADGFLFSFKKTTTVIN